MTPDEIRASMIKVGQAMTDFTAPYLAKVYEVHSPKRGRFLGSGTYIALDDQPYLLTAAHVPRKATTNSWAYSRGNGVSPGRIGTWHCLSHPEDLALAKIDAAEFAQGSGNLAISPHYIADRSDDLNGDFLFLHGWPGEQTKEFWDIANGIASTSLPYTTTISDAQPEWFDPRVHFSIDFRPENQVDENGQAADIPSPHGMSGSVVWKANWSHDRGEWTPEQARIIGVAFAWDQHGKSLTCTKIEVVRRFINLTLHREAAYEHWEKRGHPSGDGWSDWFGVEPYMLPDMSGEVDDM